MDPLTALRSFTSPAANPAALAQQVQQAQQGLPDSLRSQPIPLKELQAIAPREVPHVSGAPLPGGSGAAFDTMLRNFVQDVNTKQHAAADSVEGVLTGQGVSLHQAMIAMEEANVSFQLMVEVRNKLLESYQELMRMQV